MAYINKFFFKSAGFICIFVLQVLCLEACQTTDSAVKSEVVAEVVHVKNMRLEIVKAGIDQIQAQLVINISNESDVLFESQQSTLQISLVGPEESSLKTGAETFDLKDFRQQAQVVVFNVAAHSEKEFIVPFTFKLPSSEGSLKQLMAWKIGKMHIEGEILSKSTAKIHISMHRGLAFPEMPIIKLDKALVSSTDHGREGDVYMSVAIENPNPFALHIESFKWQISVAGQIVLPFEEGALMEVPAGQIAIYEERILLRKETFGSDLKEVLQNDSVPYNVEVELRYDGFPLQFKKQGEMNFSR